MSAAPAWASPTLTVNSDRAVTPGSAISVSASGLPPDEVFEILIQGGIVGHFVPDSEGVSALAESSLLEP